MHISAKMDLIVALNLMRTLKSAPILRAMRLSDIFSAAQLTHTSTDLMIAARPNLIVIPVAWGHHTDGRDQKQGERSTFF